MKYSFFSHSSACSHSRYYWQNQPHVISDGWADAIFGFYEEVRIFWIAPLVPLYCINASLLLQYDGAVTSTGSDQPGQPLQIKTYDYTKPGFQEGTGHFS